MSHRAPVRSRFILHAILAGLALAVASNLAAETPEFAARTDRGRYGFGEPVWLYVTIANPGPGPLAVENPRCSRTTTTIEMADESGRVFPMTGPASCSTTILEQIPEGRDMVYAFELLEHYGVDGAQEFPFGFLPPGSYEVRYRTRAHVTETVEFRVEELDDADLGSFHDYVRLLGDTRADNLREATVRFRSFVEQWPGSPFAAAVLCRAGVISDLFFDSAQARRDFDQLLRLFPESGYASVAVRHLAFGMGRNRDEGHALLAEIAVDLPGTLAADLARRVLERVPESAQSAGG